VELNFFHYSDSKSMTSFLVLKPWKS
jgi:hypothetical protein